MGHMDVSENLVHSPPMDFKCPSFFPYKIFDIDRAHVDKRTVTVDMHILSSYLVIIVSHLNIYISWRYTKFRRFSGLTDDNNTGTLAFEPSHEASFVGIRNQKS
jgi:hypothetical protein